MMYSTLKIVYVVLWGFTLNSKTHIKTKLQFFSHFAVIIVYSFESKF